MHTFYLLSLHALIDTGAVEELLSKQVLHYQYTVLWFDCFYCCSLTLRSERCVGLICNVPSYHTVYTVLKFILHQSSLSQVYSRLQLSLAIVLIRLGLPSLLNLMVQVCFYLCIATNYLVFLDY